MDTGIDGPGPRTAAAGSPPGRGDGIEGQDDRDELHHRRHEEAAAPGDRRLRARGAHVGSSAWRSRRTATRRRSAGRGDRRCPPGRRGLRPRPALPDGRLRGPRDRGVPGIAQGDLPRENAYAAVVRTAHAAATAMHAIADARGAGGEAAGQRRTAAGSPAAAPGGSLGRPGRAGCLHGGRGRRRCRGLCRRLHGRGRRGLQEAAGARARAVSRGRAADRPFSGRAARAARTGGPPGPESRHEEPSTPASVGHGIVSASFQSPRRGVSRATPWNRQCKPEPWGETCPCPAPELESRIGSPRALPWRWPPLRGTNPRTVTPWTTRKPVRRKSS